MSPESRNGRPTLRSQVLEYLFGGLGPALAIGFAGLLDEVFQREWTDDDLIASVDHDEIIAGAQLHLITDPLWDHYLTPARQPRFVNCHFSTSPDLLLVLLFTTLQEIAVGIKIMRRLTLHCEAWK